MVTLKRIKQGQLFAGTELVVTTTKNLALTPVESIDELRLQMDSEELTLYLLLNENGVRQRLRCRIPVAAERILFQIDQIN